jgi:glucokinase
MTERLIACCDLGGTKMLAGLMTPDCKLLASEKYPLGSRIDPESVITDLDACLKRMLAEIGRPREDIAALGFSCTGVLNVERGWVYMNNNMGWLDVPFRAMVAERLGIPVVLEMDANAAALGEFWMGQARGYDSFAFVIVGTGVGAGIILKGDVWRGANGTANEIGHTVILPNGPLCSCGKHGCLEALASGWAIARKAEAAVTLGRKTILKDRAGSISGQHVAEAARAGDEVAQEILNEAAFYLGIGLSNLITIINPQAIVLGGGVGAGVFDLIEVPLNRAVQQHLNYWSMRDTPILRAALDEKAGLYGAAWAAIHSLSDTIISEVPK